jgi:hypothetical protein
MTKKFILPMLATILVVSMALAASAFKTANSPKEKKAVTTKYFKFNGSSTGDYTNPLMWDVSDNPYSSCENSVTACTVSSTSLADEDELTDFLINSGGSPRNPNTDYGTDYVVESKRAAF